MHPSSVVTNEMGSAILSCDATSVIPIAFHWEKFSDDKDTWGHCLVAPALMVHKQKPSVVLALNKMMKASIGVLLVTQLEPVYLMVLI